MHVQLECISLLNVVKIGFCCYCLSCFLLPQPETDSVDYKSVGLITLLVVLKLLYAVKSVCPRTVVHFKFYVVFNLFYAATSTCSLGHLYRHGILPKSNIVILYILSGFCCHFDFVLILKLFRFTMLERDKCSILNRSRQCS